MCCKCNCKCKNQSFFAGVRAGYWKDGHSRQYPMWRMGFAHLCRAINSMERKRYTLDSLGIEKLNELYRERRRRG